MLNVCNVRLCKDADAFVKHKLIVFIIETLNLTLQI